MKNYTTAKNILIKLGSIILVSFLILIFYLQGQKDSQKTNLSTIVSLNDKFGNHFLVQDSLITDLDSIKRIIYLGYSKNRNDTLKWNDIIKIYHLKSNDTILKNDITFLRHENEGRILLMDKSLIPNETIIGYSFTIQTAISNKGNFSDNIFAFNCRTNKYEFIKRINYMDYINKDTVALKTIFPIKNKVNLDSTEMNSIFKRENEIYHGIYPVNSNWIIGSNSCFQQSEKVDRLKKSTSSVESIDLTTMESEIDQKVYKKEYQSGDSTKIIELDIHDCCVEKSNSGDIYGVIQIKQEIEKISILASIDTELDILPMCKKQKLEKKYNKNTIKINQSELYLKNDLNGIDLSLFIPEKIFFLKKRTKIFIVFEMYNFSYTTVGGGYTYIIIGLDKSNEIINHKIYEYKKKPIEINLLLRECK